MFACAAPRDVAPSDGAGVDVAQTGDTAVTTGPGAHVAPPLELCVNEIAPSNQASWQDETGATPDWIEVHNPGAAPVDLLGWSLSDDRDDPGRHRFTASFVIEPGAFVVFAADGRPELGPAHLSFSLAADGEEVALYRLADDSAEVVAYGGVAPDVAIARASDCGPIDAWTHLFGGTPGAPNTP